MRVLAALRAAKTRLLRMVQDLRSFCKVDFRALRARKSTLQKAF
jgi:hypothetical protein